MNTPLPRASEIFGPGPEDAVTFTATDGRYIFGALNGAIEFIVDHLRRERHNLVGEIEVRCTIAGARTYGDHRTLLVTGLNFSNARSRQDLGRMLAERARTSADVDWVGILEDCSQRIWVEERAGTPAVLLHQVARPAPDATLDVFGLRVLQHHPQIIFSPGGTGKSLLGSAIVGELGRMGIPTLLLDWEMDGGEQRSRADALGLPPTIWYRRCDQPLVVLADSIRRDVLEHNIAFLLIDSVAPACSGRVEESDVAIEFFKAWRRIGRGGIAIAHTRAEDGEQRPFGSVFWHNLARSTWFLKRVNESVTPNKIALGVFHRKSNFGPLRLPFGLEMTLEGPEERLEMVTIKRTDISQVSELASELPLWQRIQGCLRHGAKTVVEIASELDAKVDTVKKAVDRDKGRAFVRLTDTADGVHRFANLEKKRVA